MNTPKTLIKQLSEELKYKALEKKCRKIAKHNNKPIYKLSQVYSGAIVKLEKNGDKLVKTPVQDFALFVSTPYLIHLATNKELEANYNTQIGEYVIDNLSSFTQSCPQVAEMYDLNEKSKLSHNDILALEQEIIERWYSNQTKINL